MSTNSVTLAKKKKRKDVELTLFILFACTLPIIHWVLFYLYTNISSIFMAFFNNEGKFGFDNFVQFFQEMGMSTSQLRIAFRNTFITFAINLVAFIPRIMVSYFIYKQIPFAKIYRILFFLPAVIFTVCTAMCFRRMTGTTGFIAEAVGNMLGLDYIPELLADSRFANYTIWAKMLWLGFPGDLIIWGGTFARIPEDVLESGKLDGVSWWTEFTKITVPLVWPTVALKLIMTFCGIFGASGDVFLLTKGEYNTMTISVWQYTTLLSGSGVKYNSTIYNYLSAVGIFMTVIAIIISLTIRKYTDKAFNDIDF